MKKLLLGITLQLGLACGAFAAASITNFNLYNIDYTLFDLTTSPKGNFTPPASGTQGGGSYYVPSANGVATVASGSASAPAFALTITNNTGSTIDKLTFTGLVIQFKGNTSGITETLNASTDGAFDASVLSISSLGGSTVNNPALTSPWSVVLSDLNMEDGSSFTITWTDANNASTDAMFGLGSVSVQAEAVPEPSVIALLAVGFGFGVWQMRRRFVRAI